MKRKEVQDFVDELDLCLINCLQIRPRATWTVIGRVLEVDPITISRRWTRLEHAGLAWVTCYNGFSNTDGVMAYVEIETAGAPVSEVATKIARDRRVVSVHHTTGSRSLVVSVIGPDPAAISYFVSESLATLDGVVAARPEIVTARYSDASKWRLRALTPEQRQALQDAYPRQDTSATAPPRADERSVLQALAADGRMSTTDLARSLRVSEATARRRLNRLLAEGRATLRCEMSQSISGWPQTGILWARTPIGALDNIARNLSTVPVVRACLTLTGRNNLMLFAWLRDVTELHQLERTISDAAPELEVTDRAYCLRSFKRTGQLIDEGGRNAGLAYSPWG